MKGFAQAQMMRPGRTVPAVLNLLVVTALLSSWVATLAVVQGASAEDALDFEIRSPFYYPAHGLAVLAVISASLLAVAGGRLKVVRTGSRIALAILIAASVIWAAVSYSIEEWLSATVVGATGPFVWLTLAFVLAGADRRVWRVIDPTIQILAYATTVLAVWSFNPAASIYVTGFTKQTAFCILLMWLGGWTLLSAPGLRGWRLLMRATPILVMLITAGQAQMRSWTVLALALGATFLLLRGREQGSILRGFRNVVVATALTFAVVFAITAYSGALEGFSSRLGDDTRTYQYLDFFSVVPVWDLLLGRGPTGTWYWYGVGDYQYFDNGFLWMLFIGGLPTLLSYGAFVLWPAIVALKSNPTGRDGAAVCLTLFWGLALTGLSTYTLPSLSLPSYLVSLYAGRCHLIVAERDRRRKHLVENRRRHVWAAYGRSAVAEQSYVESLAAPVEAHQKNDAFERREPDYAETYSVNNEADLAESATTLPNLRRALSQALRRLKDLPDDTELLHRRALKHQIEEVLSRIEQCKERALAFMDKRDFAGALDSIRHAVKLDPVDQWSIDLEHRILRRLRLQRLITSPSLQFAGIALVVVFLVSTGYRVSSVRRQPKSFSVALQKPIASEPIGARVDTLPAVQGERLPLIRPLRKPDADVPIQTRTAEHSSTIVVLQRELEAAGRETARRSNDSSIDDALAAAGVDRAQPLKHVAIPVQGAALPAVALPVPVSPPGASPPSRSPAAIESRIAGMVLEMEKAFRENRYVLPKDNSSSYFSSEILRLADAEPTAIGPDTRALVDRARMLAADSARFAEQDRSMARAEELTSRFGQALLSREDALQVLRNFESARDIWQTVDSAAKSVALSRKVNEAEARIATLRKLLEEHTFQVKQGSCDGRLEIDGFSIAYTKSVGACANFRLGLDSASASQARQIMELRSTQSAERWKFEDSQEDESGAVKEGMAQQVVDTVHALSRLRARWNK